MTFLMICGNKDNKGKGEPSMLQKYRVNLSDINDIDIFKKINCVYFEFDEDRLSEQTVEKYLNIEQKIIQINAKIKIFNSPQIISFLRNKYEQHLFFQDICKDNSIFLFHILRLLTV